MEKKQFLAALMLTVLLTGCGGSGKAAATQKDPVQVQTGYTAEMEQDANQAETEPAAQQDENQAETGPAALPDEGRADQEKTDLRKTLSRDGYTLQQVVVLSRHNIRSPLSGSGSELEKLTPHEWISWSSNPKFRAGDALCLSQRRRGLQRGDRLYLPELSRRDPPAGGRDRRNTVFWYR